MSGIDDKETPVPGSVEETDTPDAAVETPTPVQSSADVRNALKAQIDATMDTVRKNLFATLDLLDHPRDLRFLGERADRILKESHYDIYNGFEEPKRNARRIRAERISGTGRQPDELTEDEKPKLAANLQKTIPSHELDRNNLGSDDFEKRRSFPQPVLHVLNKVGVTTYADMVGHTAESLQEKILKEVSEEAILAMRACMDDHVMPVEGLTSMTPERKKAFLVSNHIGLQVSWTTLNGAFRNATGLELDACSNNPEIVSMVERIKAEAKAAEAVPASA